MQEQERVRYLTQNFGGLQGLNSVLAGVAILLSAQSLAWSSGWSLVVLVGGLVGTLALWPVVNGYYERTFGLVRPAPNARPRSWSLVRAAGAGVAAVLWGVEIYARPTVMVVLIGLALGLCALWWTERPFKNYYLVAAVILVGVALLPLMGLLPSERSVRFDSVLIMGFSGMVMVVGGVLDHRTLARNMKPLPEEEGDGSTV